MSALILAARTMAAVALMLQVVHARAETSEATATGDGAAAAQPATATETTAVVPTLHVESVWSLDEHPWNGKPPRRPASVVQAPLGGRVAVRMSPGDLPRLREAAAKSAKDYGLLIDGQFLYDSQPVQLDDDVIAFRLVRGSMDRATWDLMLADKLFDRSPIALALGTSDGVVAASCKYTLALQVFDGWANWLVAAFLLAFLAKTYSLAVSTPMLRDAAGSNAGSCWSLGRVQMAFWFVNVVVAYLLLWSVLGEAPELTSSVLVLLGIGAGTALTAAVMDGKRSTLCMTPPAERASIRALFSDILKEDGEAISLHRYQLVIWTAVMFFVFWGSVLERMAMPQFGETMLALQGITAGTYLGFKVPSSTEPDPQAVVSGELAPNPPKHGV